MQKKLCDLLIKENSKGTLTERKVHQLYKSLLENMNAIKVGEEKSGVIWHYLTSVNKHVCS